MCVYVYIYMYMPRSERGDSRVSRGSTRRSTGIIDDLGDNLGTAQACGQIVGIVDRTS